MSVVRDVLHAGIGSEGTCHIHADHTEASSGMVDPTGPMPSSAAAAAAADTLHRHAFLSADDRAAEERTGAVDAQDDQAPSEEEEHCDRQDIRSGADTAS